MNTATDAKTLVGIAELADLFGVGRTTISNWYARQNTNGFPEPVVDLAMGPVWDRDDVVKWWKGYKPLRNMPKVGTLPPELASEELDSGGDTEWVDLGVPSGEVVDESITEHEDGSTTTERAYSDGGGSVSWDFPVERVNE